MGNFDGYKGAETGIKYDDNLKPKEKDVWTDFWTKAEHVFIGFSNGGEYNDYLSQIDDEGKRFIEDFITQNFISKKDLIKELEGMKKQIGYNVWAGNIDENHNAAVGYSQAIDNIIKKYS
jgi:predicted esterase